MKEDLCKWYSTIMKSRGYSFTEVASATGMSRSQVNNIINHNGLGVSMEKIIKAFNKLGYNINFTLDFIE